MERLAEDTDAVVVLAHHFAKADPAVKDPIDRMSGAGAWGRDPDCIPVLTPHEEPDCFTVSSILRTLPALPEFVVHSAYPRMLPAVDLERQSLRTRQGRKEILTDREFLEKVVAGVPQSWAALMARSRSASIADTTAKRYLQRLTTAGIIKSAGGFYWVGNPENEGPRGASPGNQPSYGPKTQNTQKTREKPRSKKPKTHLYIMDTEKYQQTLVPEPSSQAGESLVTPPAALTAPAVAEEVESCWLRVESPNSEPKSASLLSRMDFIVQPRVGPRAYLGFTSKNGLEPCRSSISGFATNAANPAY